MPEKTIAHGLNAIDGEKIALQLVKVEVELNNLLCQSTMHQVYRNMEKKSIEAVYTFPLTSRAVMLSLTVTIGGRQLRGLAVEKASAEEQYEEGITNGDAAIMLEQVQPGLYTMNVGNILAGEEVEMTICTAELHAWQGDTLRFHLPTTIAPRYGSPESVGQPHQTPEYDLLAENRFLLRLNLSGFLARARLDCPSHHITVTKSTRATIVNLAGGGACMDRDFILNIYLPQAEKDAALLDHDLDGGFVALASFAPRLPASEEIPPRSVKIVVDCSSSMNGDAIAQARQAISDILGQLRPQDFFNLVAFGSTSKIFFDRQVLADSQNITAVRRLLRSLEADMGGTEMRQALQAAVQLPGPAFPQDILLITDGEVWEHDEIIHMMQKSAHRVFTVGVGSSVSEAFVRRLADETGGGCELVVPNEEMTEKIVRHFKRIFLPRAENVAVRWPLEPAQIIPCHLGPVFDGDTLHVFACFSERPSGTVFLDITLADGRTFSQTADLRECKHSVDSDDPASPLARMAIFQSLGEQDEKQATELAVRYQLVSRFTNYFILDVRAEGAKGEELPQLRKVPQMTAAGWGGTGTVVQDSAFEYDIPVFSRRPSPEQEHRRLQQTSPEIFIHKCNRLHIRWFLPILRIESFDDLLMCDLPDRILEALRTTAAHYDPEPPEELIVLAFLVALIRSPIRGEFNRNTKRAIKRAAKRLRPEDGLLNSMSAAFAGISKDDWGPRYPFVEEEDEEGGDNDERS